MALLPEGQYPAEALEIQFGHTSTGKEQYVGSFKILGEAGRTLRVLQTFRVFEGNTPEKTENARTKRMEELHAIGFDWNTMSLPEKPRSVVVVIQHEPDQHDPSLLRERIQWINAENRGITQKAPMGEGERLAFAARMRPYAASVAPQGDAKEPVAGTALATKEPEPWEKDEAWSEPAKE